MTEAHTASGSGRHTSRPLARETHPATSQPRLSRKVTRRTEDGTAATTTTASAAHSDAHTHTTGTMSTPPAPDRQATAFGPKQLPDTPPPAAQEPPATRRKSHTRRTEKPRGEPPSRASENTAGEVAAHRPQLDRLRGLPLGRLH